MCKLVLLAGLFGYHLVCGRIRKEIERDECRWTSRGLRIWNEVATLFLVAIVFVAVFRNALSVLWAVVGLTALGLVMMATLITYERIRTNAAPPVSRSSGPRG